MPNTQFSMLQGMRIETPLLDTHSCQELTTPTNWKC